MGHSSTIGGSRKIKMDMKRFNRELQREHVSWCVGLPHVLIRRLRLPNDPPLSSITGGSGLGRVADTGKYTPGS